MSVTAIRPRRVPMTEVEILKSRYDEARQIKDAWAHRLKLAQQDHSHAFHHGGDTDATRRNLTAVEINFTDAAGELKVALDAWMHVTLQHERRAS